MSYLKISLTLLLCIAVTEVTALKQQLPTYFSHVDFDSSYGCNDPFYKQHYAKVLNQLSTGKYSNLSPIGLTSHNANFLFKFLRHMYQKNNISKLQRSETPRIPKIIHQIWVGSPFPEKYRHWQKTWQKMGPGWKYMLWTDTEIAALDLKNKALYNQSKNYGAKSDIARMEILYRYGGIYVDTDFECLKPALFNELNHYYDFYTGMHPIDSGILLENALIASAPGNPIVKGYIDDLPAHFSRARTMDVIFQTGPFFFTQVILKHAIKHHNNMMIFPPTFFYPLGFSYSQEHKHMSTTQIKKATLKAESAAIHWWEGSWWSKKNRNNK